MVNKNDKLIGTFELQAQVFKKIVELKEKGYREEDMYVVAKDKGHTETLQGKTKANISTDDHGSWKEKFKSVFTNRDQTNISEDSGGSNDYERDIDNGRILLYVDRDFAGTYADAPGRTSGTQTNSAATTAGTSGAHTSGTDEESIRLHEERLNVDKERVKTGEVNVGKHVVEEEKNIEVPVEREEVYVERRPVNEETTSTSGGLSGKDAYQDENDNIRVPVTEERVDVSKKEVVGEEIVVGKKKVKDTEHVSETVRREEADIDEDASRNRNSSQRDNPNRGL